MPTTSVGWEKSGIAVTEMMRRTPSRPMIPTRACAGRRSASAIPPGSSSSGERRSVEILDAEERRPFRGRHRARFGERPTEDLLRGLVVEDEIAVRVRDEGRRREL